ncbi:MAG: transposase [Myxococcales bacterium]|nr:transposase [Myxococcales bacterium]
MRRRIESMFSAAFKVRRAVQSDARHRSRAYRAAHHERSRDPAAVRTRIGLSREALERAAYRHVDGAPHLRRFVTKALAMHLADNVWTATERHLFKDASGATRGMPHIGRWFDFTRLPGRARSHTTERKWETFRLHGSLAGHRAAYTQADGRFFQPDRMRAVADPKDSWWSHQGPLVVVFSGLPGGSLVLPVRLPAAPSNQPILEHHLADPSRWHKIDLVRRRDPQAAGGWRYEAHLLVLADPYVAPAAQARRQMAAIKTAARRGGIDVNVSNVTVASHESGRDLQIRRIELGAAAKAGARRRAIQDRRRQRHLERSRRAANRDQYQWSKRQEKRARRRELAGLAPVQTIPAGPRKARSDGKPLQAYRKDQLSASYRRGRISAAAEADAASQARRDHARQVAAVLVRDHGYQLVVEDCNVGTWARRWGAALAAFSPATLLSAIEREAAAVALVAGGTGGVLRASTQTTALSQHCLCGARVPKTLADRVHACAACGLRGDRDAVSATLAAFVAFTDPTQPSTARVDLNASRACGDDRHTRTILDCTLELHSRGRQDAPSESNALTSHGGFSAAERGRTPDAIVVARRTAGTAPYPTPHEPGLRQTTAERARMRTSLTYKVRTGVPALRDSS